MTDSFFPDLTLGPKKMIDEEISRKTTDPADFHNDD